MGFFDDVTLVVTLLQRDGRLTYRALQREFGFDAASLDDLRRELIFRRIAVDEQGEGLVWTGVALLAGQPSGFMPYTAVPPSALLADLPALNLAVEVLTAAPRLDTSAPPFEAPLASPDTIPPHVQQEPFTVASPDGVATAPARSAPDAERRQLTVMFCDLVGSTDLSGKLDPEDLRDVVRAYQETAAKVVERYEGHIAQYLGDGLLIYFGFPVAHEDDAQRAVYTGLGIPEVMAALNTRLETDYGVQLAVRIGIHTGPVVVGEMGGGGRHENLALGETPNIAARLEGLAQPNTAVISPITAQLVQRAFVLEELGPHALKGVAEPMQLFTVVSHREAEHDDHEAMLAGGFNVLVGRNEEIGLLLRRWEQSKEGQGQVVLISGDAGLGKSSLVEGLRAHVRQEGHTRVAFRCSPYTANSALHPVIEHLQRVCDWQRDDTAETKLAKLEQVLQGISLALEETVPLVAALLSLPLPEDRYPALPLTPGQLRRQMQDTVVALVLEESERQPVLAVWEDLHWADPSTLELLGLLVDQTPTSSILHVLTFRPEFEPPWAPRSHLTPISLNPLGRSQMEAVVAQLAMGKPLPAEMIDHIVTKTDGVPLYAEELTKMLLSSELLREESDRYELTGPLLSMAIPDTLQDSLMARLDQLNTAKEIAQLGAVLGRTFSYKMLQALAAMEEERVRQGLSQLVQAELLYQRGRPPRATYIFKHALIQDAAYASLLRQTRQQMHQRIAQLFETQFPEVVETRPELVAHHYRHSAHTEPAIAYLQRAGRQAAQRAAYAESITHLTTALDLLGTLPATPERHQQELALQLALGTPLMVARGYGAPAVERAFTRARQLCEHLGDTSQLASLLQRGWNLYLVHAELSRARALGEELLTLAQSQHDDTLRLRAFLALGITLYYSGLFAPAQTHLEQGLALYDPDQHHSQRGLQDPRVTALGHLAWLQWLQGYPDRARQLRAEMLSQARHLAHPNTLAAALIYAAGLSVYLREVQPVHEWAEEAMALGTEHGFVLYWVIGAISRGWALAMQEQGEAGITEMRQGLTAHQGQGAALDRPGLLGLLAEACGQTGQSEAGLSALAEALEQVETTGERCFEAELYRRKGVLLLAQSMDHQSEARSCFQQALDIAHRQAAKSWELRATSSLARLWQQQGKQQEARELLVPIYDWFTEGFDTVDLQEARALLDELGE